MAALAATAADNPNAPPLLVGTGKDRVHLLVAITADRGLAGAFNSNVARAVRVKAKKLLDDGKTVKILSVGRKGNDSFRRDMNDKLAGYVNFIGKKTIEFKDAEEIATQIIHLFRDGAFDVATLVFNRFVNTMTQVVHELPLIPAAPPAANDDAAEQDYEIEPDDGTLLERLLPRNIAVQIYAALLENSAGFYASQMTAMDNATRNAGDMIKKLSLSYNRARQANITTELIEIIAGAEAV